MLALRLSVKGEIEYHLPMETATTRSTNIRERAKDAARQEIARVALRLFTDHGFEGTTADQIAAAAGISRSTFFRYFATKDEVVLGQFEQKGHELVAEVRARPSSESAWAALHQGFLEVVRRGSSGFGSDDTAVRLAQLQVYNGALRAAGLSQRARWRSMLAPEIASRLGTSFDDDPRPAALAAAAIGCLETAVVMWGRSGGKADLEHLVNIAMSELGRT